MKDITVCILTHNREEQLPYSLESLIEQFGKSLKIIILNNGSTDKTSDILQKSYSKYSNIKILNSSKNLGVSKGRAFLWEHVQTPYILSIDDDILISFETLKSMYSHFNLNKKIGLVSPNIKDSKSELIINIKSSKGLPTFYEACFLIRREIIKSIGAFDSRLMFAGEGMDYALRLNKAGFTIFRDVNSTVTHYDRERSQEDSDKRRLQWLWSFCFVYWKNLNPVKALYWSIRNVIAHTRTGLPEFGIKFVVKLPKQAIAGSLAGIKARYTN